MILLIIAGKNERNIFKDLLIENLKIFIRDLKNIEVSS